MVVPGLKFPTCMWAQLPSATLQSSIATGFFCPDTPVGSTFLVSDGTNWRPFARGIFPSRTTITAAMAGKVVITYPIQFTVLPCLNITLSDPGAGGRLTASVIAESTSGCTVQVTRGQILPALSSLVGFDAFTGGNVTGVVVSLTAIPLA